METKSVYPFDFSVVMAVYNCEPFLAEAIDSLIAQDHGFHKIQLILVDDGSTDGSAAICDDYVAKHPDNIMVIHKPNGGVSSARNEGLKYATGRFLNFMDSDDKFSSNAFRRVFAFFTKYEQDIDIVTIPIYYFDGAQAPHWQNYKFGKKDRIIDLFRQHEVTLMAVTASFFANRIKNDIWFDPMLVIAEDAKAILTVLSFKMKFGTVVNCKYLYRKRSVGEASLIQSSTKKRGWYFEYFTHYTLWALDFYKEKFGYVPDFVQYQLLSDLQWRFQRNADITSCLTEEEYNQHKTLLFDVLSRFDDKHFLSLKMIWGEQKCYMLSKKYGVLPTLTPRGNDILIHFGNTIVSSLGKHQSVFEFLTIKNNSLTLEGYIKIYGIPENEMPEIYLNVNGTNILCETFRRESFDLSLYGDLVLRGIGFCGTVSLCENTSNTIRLVLKYKDTYINKSNLKIGRHFPITQKYKSGYCHAENWLVSFGNGSLQLEPSTKSALLHREAAFCKELFHLNKANPIKPTLGRLLCRVLRIFKKKPIWLFSDRIVKADDNAEALLSYLLKQKITDKKLYYILSKDSPDYARIKKFASVVEPFSYKHRLLFLLCDMNISSHADLATNNAFWSFYEPYRDLMWQHRFVFLQHGITINDLAGWLNRYNQNMSGVLTAANPEYHSYVEGKYYYDKDKIWLTGFPRHDKLYHDEQNIITIMPTWRMYLMERADQRTGLRKLRKDFKNTSYFMFYNSLINHPRLLDAAQKHGYHIQFMPHPTIQPHLSVFDANPNVHFHGLDTKYSEIYAQSNLVITDYSSASFDFSYLRKPVIYCQFDRNEAFSGKHVFSPGYFDYERDGFGEVETELEATVDRIIEYMENGCKLKEVYRKRIDNFFAFNDRNNCERVYQKLLELEKNNN